MATKTSTRVTLSREDFKYERQILCSKCSVKFTPESRNIKTCPLCIRDLKEIEWYKAQIKKRRTKNLYVMSEKINNAIDEIQKKRLKNV